MSYVLRGFVTLVVTTMTSVVMLYLTFYLYARLPRIPWWSAATGTEAYGVSALLAAAVNAGIFLLARLATVPRRRTTIQPDSEIERRQDAATGPAVRLRLSLFVRVVVVLVVCAVVALSVHGVSANFVISGDSPETRLIDSSLRRIRKSCAEPRLLRTTPQEPVPERKGRAVAPSSQSTNDLCAESVWTPFCDGLAELSISQAAAAFDTISASLVRDPNFEASPGKAALVQWECDDAMRVRLEPDVRMIKLVLGIVDTNSRAPAIIVGLLSIVVGAFVGLRSMMMGVKADPVAESIQILQAAADSSTKLGAK